MNILNELARIVLPSEILEDFEIVKIEQSETLIEISAQRKNCGDYNQKKSLSLHYEYT